MKTVLARKSEALRRFARDESGAVTVDWVVLTAAIVGMVMALFVILNQGIFESAALAITDNIDDAVQNY